MPYIQIGSGLLFLNPNAGNLATNPTPVKPFTLQDVKIDAKGTIKELMGQYQWPDDTAVVDKKGTFEFSMGRKDWQLIQQIFNADTTATGGTSVAVSPATAIPASPYTITPTIPGSGTASEDLGVVNAATNAPFIKVTSAPAAGQYSYSAGVYTFSSADHTSGISVIIAMSYTITTPGTTFQINNQTQGYGPAFEAFIVDNYQPASSSIYSAVRLYAAKISDVSITNKRADYAMVDLKGSFFANSSGQVLAAYSNVG